MAFWKRRRRAAGSSPSDDAPPPPAPTDVAFGYHQRTKHRLGRFAPSLGYLDWDTQPDPFRRFAGAELVRLWLPTDIDDSPPYDALFGDTVVPARPVDRDSISELLYYSLALSAWKSYQTSRWSLRVNPSSGNLHPTEAYLALPPLAGIDDHAGLHHYAPAEHGLERRARWADELWQALTSGLPRDAFLIALTSIPWRESWKYGERAWRYCQHDVGHAVAALRFACALLGWRLVVLHDVDDAALEGLLGLDRPDASHEDEREVPDLLAAIVPSSSTNALCVEPTADIVERARSGEWFGRANRLSPEHHVWDVLPVIEQACHEKRREGPGPWLAHDATTTAAPTGDEPPGPAPPAAGRIVRTRRSAVDMDGRTTMPRGAFERALRRLVPALTPTPWDALGGPHLVHLGLFVHRVDGLPPGLYALPREPGRIDSLRDAMRDEFRWETPEGCPADLPLYRLAEGDVRNLAAHVSCQQAVAGDGAFSLGMIAEFEQPLRRYGAGLYRRLFWETGVIGQTLYLEAEAAGLRGTGIGCFFDDEVHAVFGLTDARFQSLYHFTVGGAVDDERLTTERAYSRTDADRLPPVGR